MFVLGNLFATLAQLTNSILTLYTWVIIIRILVSWVHPDPFNPVMQFLTQVTDPYLNFFRRFIPPIGMLDISPIAAILVLQAAQHFLVRTLVDLSIRLR